MAEGRSRIWSGGRAPYGQLQFPPGAQGIFGGERSEGRQFLLQGSLVYFIPLAHYLM